MEENKNIFGCFVSSHTPLRDREWTTKNAPPDKGDLFRQYIWGKTGLDKQLKTLNRGKYGKDMNLILFQFYVNPIPYLLAHLKDIERYRPKEKAIGVPILIKDDNFFDQTEADKKKFLKATILEKLDLVMKVVKRNNLDTDIQLLKSDVEKILS